jgi:NAD(P)-dependent dehydrogenase (short-subunit alcohol dehydrogenase family)
MSKVWFVTGSSRGLGLHIASTLLNAGEIVVATARKPEAVIAALGESEGLLALPLDVTDEDAPRCAATMAVDRFGRIDVLVNNAGYGHFGPFEEATAEAVADQFQVNLFGAMHVTGAVLPHMRRQGSGRIFNISSIAGISGFPMCSLYCASKFAMEGWSESIAMELAPLGIQVTAIEPGFFRTDFLAQESVRYTEPTHEEYRRGMADLQAWLNGQHKQQVGDPVRLAQVLMDLAKSERQPKHLLLGSDAVQRWYDKIQRDSVETAQWKATSESTDFPR